MYIVAHICYNNMFRLYVRNLLLDPLLKQKKANRDKKQVNFREKEKKKTPLGKSNSPPQKGH